MPNSKNKIIIAAGTGFIGQALIEYFSNYEIVVLTRNRNQVTNKHNQQTSEHILTTAQQDTGNPIGFNDTNKNQIKQELYRIRDTRFVSWNAKSLGEWSVEFENAKAVINLTGKSVNCRYNEKNKAEILASRIDSTKIIGEAINACKNPPKIWINAGSATIYPHSLEKQNTERVTEFADDFSVQVCKAWEKTFNEIETPKTRKLFLRITIVLGKKGGVFKTLKSLAKIGLGGNHGDGNQYISWIHEKDLCRSIEFLMHNKNLSGTFNCAAPNPMRNKDFMQIMRKQLKVPFGLPQPKWMLAIGTWFMRTEMELVLKSRNVVPEKLLEEGFKFEYNTVEDTMEDLCS